MSNRFFIEEDLRPGKSVFLPSSLIHRLRHVLRLGEGAQISLFNGREGEWKATLTISGRDKISAIVGERIRCQETSPDLWLVFSPIKRHRLDILVEKATELGVRRLLPVISQFTMLKHVSLPRLQTLTHLAAEQCERLDIPEIEAVQPLENFLKTWQPERRLLLCVTRQATPPIGHILEEARQTALSLAPSRVDTPPPSWAIMIGPEGGFSAQELRAFDQWDTVFRVSLGPGILRSETAAITALACWQMILGDQAKAG